MGVRYNLSPNPACANDATGWSSSPSGYARSTSVDAALPRATGFEGAGAADVNTPRAAVTPGASYVFSVSIKALAAQNFGASVNFYTALSGGSFISNSGNVGQPAMSTGNIQRIVLGPITAPAGAASAQFKLAGLDAGGAEITAVRVSPSTGDLAADSEYFDGSTPGAAWDGAAGSSTSTTRVIVESIGLADSWGKTSTAVGPVGSDGLAFAESFSIAASGAAVELVAIADAFLIARAEYDAQRGRVRIEAFTFPAAVTAMRVSSRVVGGHYALVRGGLVPVLDGYAVRPVDDYEYPAGRDVEYLIEGLDEGSQVVTTATVLRLGAEDRPWIKVIADPASNVRVVLLDEPVEITRPARTALYDVQGRSDPVVVSDVAGSRRFTVRVVVEGDAAADDLDETLALGTPIYLQVPPGGPVPSIYGSVGEFSRVRSRRRSDRWIFTLPLVEVAAPPPTIAGTFATWASVLSDYASWDALLAGESTWREVAA